MTADGVPEALAREIPALAPLDEHNAALARNVHPPDWVNPEPAARYDLVVIGAGTAGLVTSAGAAGLGARVALVERELLGGDCLNVGCVPSKALIACARAAAEARAAGAFGLRFGGEIEVDFPAVMERMRRLRAGISAHDSARRFRELGVDVFLGAAAFAGPDAVEVGGRRLRFKRAVIATGARAAAPPIPGLSAAGYLTNETLFSLTELPRRLAVVGAGPIGCEMAQAFARFGSQVDLVDLAPHVLGRDDADAARIVQRALERDGVRLHLGAALKAVRVEGAEKILDLRRDGVAQELAADAILVGVGRAPNVDLGLESAGVGYDRRDGVVVDDRLRTSNRRVFAAGDVCSAHKFTHTADAAARIVIQNALFSLGPFGRARVSRLVVPWTTYTDPELAHVGLSAREAEQRGLAVDTIELDPAAVDRAVLEGESEGLLKVHVERGRDRIVGATLVARHAGELISELSLAIVARAGLKTLARTIHPYPTRAELLRRAGDAYNKTRLTPRAARFLRLLLRLRR